MTILEQFRVWIRRAPTGQRASAGAGAALIVALVAWLVLPKPIESSQQLTVGGAVQPGDVGPGISQAGAPQSGSPTGSEPSSDSEFTGTTAPNGSGPSPKMSTSRSPSGSGCVSLPGTDQGVTKDEIRIAVLLIELAGPLANSVVGVSPVEEQQADYEAVVKQVNENGGIACRRLVADYYSSNPLDSTNLQRTCLQILDTKPFFVIDSGTFFLYPQLTSCYTSEAVPIFTPGLLPRDTQRASYPYLFGGGLHEVTHRNMILALDVVGYYDNLGSGKVGLYYRSCNSKLGPSLVSWLKQVGITENQIVIHDIGCPVGPAPPADTSQAIIDFQRNGVTHVITVEAEIDFSAFTDIAEQQGFRPRYAVPGVQIGQSYSSQHPNYDNLANALSMAQLRSGEERTPGIKQSPGTKVCDKAYAKAGRGNIYGTTQRGNYCAAIWMLRAGVENSTAVARNQIALGLQREGTMDLPYLLGPADFRTPYATYAGQYWRPVKFFRACDCWRLIETTPGAGDLGKFYPAFP